MPKLVQAAALARQIAAILVATGSTAQEAAVVADNLVMANLSGHDSHGVGMVPRYVEAVREGGLVPNAGARVTLDAGALLALDGQRGYGQVVGVQALQLAMARTREQGCCVLALANSHHLGRIGHFAEMAAAAGLVSIHFVNVLSQPVVAPWGGTDGRYGTNPFCAGVPLPGREPFVLDMATSRAAHGKMRVAHNMGVQVEPGYLLDGQGEPTTDPGVVMRSKPGGGFDGALLPFGEHKGYGLAMACELLAGALTGSGTLHRPADTRRTIVNGMLSVLVDPGRLDHGGAFGREALAFVDWVRQSPAAAGGEGVRIAGEPEQQARARRTREGIPLDERTWSELLDAGRSAGVDIDQLGTP